MRPLDRLRSLKLKLGVVIVAGVVVSDLTALAAVRLGLPLIPSAVAAAALALALVLALVLALGGALLAAAQPRPVNV